MPRHPTASDAGAERIRSKRLPSRVVAALRAVGRRPVGARLREPLALAAAVAIWRSGLPDDEARTLLRVLALFAVARLVSVTAPNLDAARELESAPFEDRSIRRSLGRVQATFVLAVGVVLLCAARFQALPLPQPLTTTGGILIFVATLATYAFCPPTLRDHRGVPIARPNPGPTAGTIAVFALSPFLRATDLDRGLLLAAACIAAGNLAVGLGRRVQEAYERLSAPYRGAGSAPDGGLARRRDERERRLLLRAAVAAPLLVYLLWPALLLVFGDDAPSGRALAAALAPALPPLLFDARRGSPRFMAAATGAAALAFACAPGAPIGAIAATFCIIQAPLARCLARGAYARAVAGAAGAMTSLLMAGGLAAGPAALAGSAALPCAAWATLAFRARP